MNDGPQAAPRHASATENDAMTVYAIAQHEQPRVLGGAWPHDKLVMMSFPDEDSFLAFSTSPDYQDISRDRKAGAQATVLLVKGFAPAG